MVMGGQPLEEWEHICSGSYLLACSSGSVGAITLRRAQLRACKRKTSTQVEVLRPLGRLSGVSYPRSPRIQLVGHQNRYPQARSHRQGLLSHLLGGHSA